MLYMYLFLSSVFIWLELIVKGIFLGATSYNRIGTFFLIIDLQ